MFVKRDYKGVTRGPQPGILADWAFELRPMPAAGQRQGGACLLLEGRKASLASCSKRRKVESATAVRQAGGWVRVQ
eukprot:scaffold76552_cov14-Tisochrysis_lutea.AAC.1